MNFMAIPDLVRVKIFLLLPSDSLHRCRQVCPGWNKFIMENIWSSKYARKQLEHQLERNWGAGSDELKYEVSSEVFDTGVESCAMLTASGDYLVLRKLPHEDFPNIVVANVVTKTTWQVTMEPKFDTRNVCINDSLLAIWSTAEDYDHDDDDTEWPGYIATLKVWSVRSKEILLEEVIPNFEHLVFDLDRSSSLSMIAVILRDKVEVLSFDDTSISRFELAFDLDIGWSWHFSNMVFPYILHCFDNNQDEFISICVWKIDDEKKQMESHKSLPRFDNCHIVTSEHDIEEVYLVDNAVYVSSCFVVTNCYKGKCIITILNEEGDFIREVKVNINRPDWFMNANILIHGKRLFLKINSVNCEIFKFDLKELLTLESNQEGFYKLVPLKQGSIDQLIVTNKTSIASVTENGEGKIKIQKMNFWPTNKVEIYFVLRNY